MKLNKILFLIPLMSLMFCFNAPKNDDDKMQMIMVDVKDMLQYFHYSPREINDVYSRDVFKDYLSRLDPDKRFFLQSDINEFKKYQNELDNYLNQGNLFFYKLTIDRFHHRIDDLDKMTSEIFSKPIDLNEDEEIVLDDDSKNYPKDVNEQKKEWKKFIKFSILQEIETMNSSEEKKVKIKDSLFRNHLKDTITLKNYTEEQKKEKAIGEVKDLMKTIFNRFKKRKQMNWFTVYMNAYTEAFDPHTNYFSPQDKEDFDTSFKGKIIGIGAVIQEKKGGLFLGELMVGAPAWKSKQLTDGDRILKVKPAPDKSVINVSGMLVDEVVRFIRGKKGTPVVLTVRKKDGTIKEVTLVRDEVEIEDTFAKSLVINHGGAKVGYIYLPSFNADFENSKGRNASDDVKAELIKLKREGVKSIILDVRNNGGGSLTEVVDMMGLFMKKGPVVQVKNRDGKIESYENRMNDPIWTGPLLIMQNELSASASEILSGAMKNYGRALILGSPASYGKGTVQTFVDLNRFFNTSEDLGSLKMTIQKFYGINGESNQLKGIESDIKLKDLFSYLEIGEKYQKHVLPWDKITAVDYQKFDTSYFAKLIKESEDRISKNPIYSLIEESAKWKQMLDKEKKITVNQNKFQELMKKRKLEIEKFKKIEKYDNGLSFILNDEEQKREKIDSVFAHKNKEWIKNLKHDFYLIEGVHVVSQMK